MGRFIHMYEGDTVFGERSGLFVSHWSWAVQSVNLIFKIAGSKKRRFEIDHGDREVSALPVWWVNLSYQNPYNKHWLFGTIRLRWGMSARGDGTFRGV